LNSEFTNISSEIVTQILKTRRNIIKEKTYNYSLEIIELYQYLYKQNEFVLSKQLVRSGTSIGANVEEAIAAQSRKDFISKMSIASKEARETNYWLRLLRDSDFCKDINLADIIDESEQLIKMLTAIVKTTQTNSKLTIKN
jgi:four helix bundle protein